MREEERIIFSDKKTNKILTRYFAYKCDGLCYFEINDEIKEQISLLRDVAIMASGHIPNFHSLKNFLSQSANAVFIIPNVPADFLTDNEMFVNSFNSDQPLWYVEYFDTASLKHSSVVHCEAIFVEVLKDCFFINATIYENKYFSSTPYSHLLSFDVIWL